ncbi:MAG: NAD(+)/NADH kinase [Clostridia bacterium]|nr:NAD(+)/NADH kinase [Clostridia bacterium]
MTKVFLIPNEKKDVGLKTTKTVVEALVSYGMDVYIAKQYAPAFEGGVTVVEDALPTDAECIITVGGDGTVLEASRIAMRLNVPLLGINLGRLGYLAELEPDQLATLSCLTKGEYAIKERMILKVTLIKDGRAWVMPRMPVNDVVFYRSAIGHVVSLSLTQGEGEGISYLADGLILSTPIGSTAYSLSAGGPILSPEVDAICATPICPHSFYNRSLIFAASGPLCVKNTSETDAITVTMDGRENFLLDPGDSVLVEKAPVPLRLLSFEERNFLDLLRRKMK